ncbi:MAG: GxxExxY protein [Puniceicoccales bacterium]|jgi:GxxExxY protein|nr:GxxExxY protein [Puniceicoccales bacterium]
MLVIPGIHGKVCDSNINTNLTHLTSVHSVEVENTNIPSQAENSDQAGTSSPDLAFQPTPLQDLCYKVTGCAITVLNTIGPGLDSKIYENCMMIELAKQGLRFEYQRKVDVVYSGKKVGVVTLGVIVNDILLVDCRSAAFFNETDFSENISYLKLTQIPMVLMLNFKFGKLQWKKIAYDPNR